METNAEKAIRLHKEWKGKISTEPKCEVKTREDLALAYTPGVAEPCKVIHEDVKEAYTYTLKQNTIAVVSDGSAVLGDEIVETVKRLEPTFGGINLEDISAPRCFEIERRLKETMNIPVFHDDQHGTAIIVLAGTINALKLTGKKKEDCRVVVNGSGAAGIAIAKLMLLYGFRHLILCDSKGIVSKDRTGLNWIKKEMLEVTNEDNK